MDILEHLIDIYENDENVSADEVVSCYLKDNPDYKDIEKTELVEIRRAFFDYVNHQEEMSHETEIRERENGLHADYVSSVLPRERRRHHNKYIEAVISNISVTRSLDELYESYLEGNNVQLLINDINEGGYTNWTVPRWIKRGDIVLFMHAKTATPHLTKIRTEVRKTLDPDSAKAKDLEHAIGEQLEVHKKYGGKIFAIGRICGKPELVKDIDDTVYYGSRVFCDIDRLFLLEEPIDISEFNGFIKISALSAHTPVYGRNYEELKHIITDKNSVPDYFVYSYSTPFPHSKVNRENWMQLGQEYRNSFTLEIQFRQCYVNYLLSSIGDQKKIFMECDCYKEGNPITYVDNVIRINRKLLPVEVKLNKNLENNLEGQCRQYCNLRRLVLEKNPTRDASLNDVINDKVLVIDTYAVYLYDDNARKIKCIYDLSDLTSSDEIKKLRETILNRLW